MNREGILDRYDFFIGGKHVQNGSRENETKM